MKTLRLVALSALVTIASASAIFYASCSKDECKNTVCKNGGSCSGSTCICPIGFTGPTCGTRSFVGRWAGTDACTPDTLTGSVIITIDTTTDSSKVMISNIAGSGSNVKFNGTISSPTTIDYSAQSVTRTIGGVTTTDTLDGHFVLTNNTTFTHTYTDRKGTQYTCSGTYSKL